MTKRKLVCISDTHGHQIEVPDGDVLIFAGDFSGSGSNRELDEFAAWINKLPHPYKIVIGGNHDRQLERGYIGLLPYDVAYLEDGNTLIEGVKFYGSPRTPTFFDWAFMADRGERIKKYWDKIPDDTDVLITHGPPHGILDYVSNSYNTGNVGCEELLKRVEVVKPKIHIFGHIHCGYGQVTHGDTTYYNVSICNEVYKPVNKPTVIEYELESDRTPEIPTPARSDNARRNKRSVHV